MKLSVLLALTLGLGLVSAAQGQEGRPVEERVRPSGRASAAEPDSPATAIVLSRENQTAESRLVKFGGVLTDSMGRPLSGEVEVTFALYKQETDEEPLWKETQKLEVDKQGGYTALIGATQPGGVPVELFRSDEARWLGVQIQGEPQGPRILLVSVPYALKAVEAEKLGGKSASDFVLSESLGDQVRRVIEGQTIVAGQATSAGTLQPGQTKSNSALTPQMTPAGPMFPPSTFSGTNSAQIVLVQQNGSGNGVVGQTASSTGASGVVGIATSTSTSNNQNGVYGQNAGAGAGVAGIATNPSVGVGVYGQAANFAGVFGQTFNPNTNGVAGIANATTGFSNGVFGQSASPNGNGVFGNNTAPSGGVGVFGQTPSPDGIGVVGINTASSGFARGISGGSNSTNGVGVFGSNNATSGNAHGVFGLSNSPAGDGVVGASNAITGGTGVFGSASATSGFANGVFGQSFSTSGTGVAGFANASSGGTSGVFGDASASPNGTGVFGSASQQVGVGGQATATAGGPAYGVWGDSISTSGTGVAAFEDATSGGTTGVFAQVVSPNGNAVFAHAGAPAGGVGVVGFTEGPNAVAGQFVAHGGSGLILQGLSGSNFNQVFSVDAIGNLSISGNLSVSGTKSSTVKLQNGREVLLYAVESPENWFEDFGSAELKSGLAWVPLDASFGEATNAAISYHVFLTPNGDSNGLYVARKTAAGFEVREHGGGGSNVAFDYRIVVRRRGYETMRMAEMQTDVKTVESSRQRLTELTNSGSLKSAGVVKAPRIAPPAIRPVPPRPIAPQAPMLNVPQPPRPR